MSRRANRAADTIYVELPPFSPSDTGAGNRFNRPRQLQAVQPETDYVNVGESGEEDEQEDDGVVQLPDENPYNRPPGRGAAGARRGGAPLSPPPPARGSARRQQPEPEPEDDDEEEQEGGTSRNGVTVLPAFNPLADRGNGGNRGRGRGGPFRSASTPQGREASPLPPTRGSGRRQQPEPEPEDDGEEEQAGGTSRNGITVLPAFNPLADRGNGGNRGRGRGGPPARTSARQGRDPQPDQDQNQDDDDDDDDGVLTIDPPPGRRSGAGGVGRPGAGRVTSPTPPVRQRQPNLSVRNAPPVALSASEDEDGDEQGQGEEPVPGVYSDGEPIPVLAPVGSTARSTGPAPKLVAAAQKAQMVRSLGFGAKPAIQSANPQGSSGSAPTAAAAAPKSRAVNAPAGNTLLFSASTDPSDESPVAGKGKQATEGTRAVPSGVRSAPVLRGSNVPLNTSETERIRVPFGKEVIRDVGRPGRRPKFPYPSYPGYPPFFPYPYPPDSTETEFVDVTDDEHEHHHHHGPHYPHDGHHHHDRHHWPHQWPPYYPPPWAPVDSNPYNPYKPFNPAPPSHHRAPFVGPLYANIPHLPSVFEQARAAFYTLPIPPTSLLQELQEAHDNQVPPEPAPQPRDPPNPATLQVFKNGYDYMSQSGTLLDALPILTYQECQSYYIDAVYRRLADIVQVRFAERRGDDIINRVHLVQRNRLAFRTVLQYRPKLDVDLVLPGDYVLRRWALNPSTPDDQKPRTISKAFKLDTAAIARAEIDATDLGWVIKAVLEQLNGSQDQFIFPGGNSEALKYIGTFDSSATVDGVNRIRLMSQSDPNPVRVNVFIKVAVEVNGQEMVVGVDQASAISAGKYQMFKLIRRPNGALGESPLSPVERSAIIALGWWKRDVVHGDPSASPPTSKLKIRASHFSIALKALHALDPSDDLYVPHARMKARPFSFGLVTEVMLKVIKYLKLAYTCPVAVAAAANAALAGKSGQGKAAEYMFPLASCGIFEALYTQAASNPGEIDALVKSGVMDDLITFLEGKLPGQVGAAGAAGAAGAGAGASGAGTGASGAGAGAAGAGAGAAGAGAGAGASGAGAGGSGSGAGATPGGPVSGGSAPPVSGSVPTMGASSTGAPSTNATGNTPAPGGSATGNTGGSVPQAESNPTGGVVAGSGGGPMGGSVGGASQEGGAGTGSSGSGSAPPPPASGAGPSGSGGSGSANDSSTTPAAVLNQPVGNSVTPVVVADANKPPGPARKPTAAVQSTVFAPK
ncbi:hypothetical protein FRC10_008978 [Ceratobasidium sp. 414]|nr:hypothetical protein FRC10_008978 [Ceratobasidium sp. 414]